MYEGYFRVNECGYGGQLLTGVVVAIQGWSKIIKTISTEQGLWSSGGEAKYSASLAVDGRRPEITYLFCSSDTPNVLLLLNHTPKRKRGEML